MSRNWAWTIRDASAAPEPAITSLLPTAMSVGTSMVASCSGVIFSRGPLMQAASAFKSLRVDSAKALKVRAVLLVTSSMRGASSALAIGPLPTMPRTMLIPSPPIIRLRTRLGGGGAREGGIRAHTLRWGAREKGGDPRAHRIAHHIGPRDAEMIEQPPPVLCHRRRTVRVGIVEFAAPSMPPIVISDHPAPRGDECSHPTRVDPVGDQVRGKAVDQQDGLALPL